MMRAGVNKVVLEEICASNCLWSSYLVRLSRSSCRDVLLQVSCLQTTISLTKRCGIGFQDVALGEIVLRFGVQL